MLYFSRGFTFRPSEMYLLCTCGWVWHVFMYHARASFNLPGMMDRAERIRFELGRVAIALSVFGQIGEQVLDINVAVVRRVIHNLTGGDCVLKRVEDRAQLLLVLCSDRSNTSRAYKPEETRRFTARWEVPACCAAATHLRCQRAQHARSVSGAHATVRTPTVHTL